MVDLFLDSLPYIDKPLSDAEINAAQELILQEAQRSSKQPSKFDNLSPLAPSYLSKDAQALVDSIGVGKKTSAIDLDKYTQLHDTEGRLLKDRALISLEYSLSRQENLALLSQFGRNQWLVANDQLEQDKQAQATYLTTLQEKQTQLNVDRKRAQLDVQPTLEYLDSRWKKAVDGLVQVNVAILEREHDLKRKRGEES